MTFADRQLFFQLFYSSALAITNKKGPDYNPDGIPLLDVLDQAVVTDIEVAQVLWVYYGKHASAIRRYVRDGRLESEPLQGRLMDAANYLAMIGFYDTHKTELHVAWRRHWAVQRCECVYDEEGPSVPILCQRCQTLSWLERRAFGLNSKETSSDSTPKARG